MWLVITLLVSAIYLVWRGLMQTTNYWKKRKVVYSKPWPLLGNMASFVFGKKTSQEFIQDLYDWFPGRRYVGMYTFLRPTLLIRDPDLIKQITIKDFDYFTDRSLFRANDYADPILSANLVSLQGQRWREMRSTLSPFFTSSKMKFMFTLISECAEDFTKYFQEQGSGVINVEMKDICSRFTTDAIATTIFGVKVDSFNQKDNEFFSMGTDMTTVEGLGGLRFVGYLTIPYIMQVLKIPILSSPILKYFKGVVKESIEAREATGNIRPDMIHLFLEARKKENSNKMTNEKGPSNGVNKNLTDDSITAQAVIFFFGGFENISTMMGFMSYELALNPDIQSRLQNEIDETLEQCHGKMTYEALLKMKYLDMVVSETLRKWPAGPLFERLCVKDYVITPKLPDEKEVMIEKGVTIFIPYGAIHRDPEYFPNPMKFDPERFSEENKSNIVPFSYMPFGVGPRYCIAVRYALMEMKIIFFHLLSKFDIVLTEKTSIPIQQSKLKLNLGAEQGIWLGLQRRK